MRFSTHLVLAGLLATLPIFAGASQTLADEKEQQKQLEAKIEEVRRAVRAAAVVVSPSRSRGYIVPTEVDPAVKTERVLLLLPGGPVIVELSMTIDGKPFQTHREQMIDEALAAADADKDGKATWEETVARPSFLGGRAFFAGLNEEQRKGSMAQYDQNKDGIVDRFEVRSLLAQVSGGPAFMVQPLGYGQPNPPVRELLDVNKDNILSADELAAAESRLKSRDANDNDILDLAELTGNVAAGGYVASANGRVTMTQPSTVLYQLHLQADWSPLFDALVRKYGKEGKLTADEMPLVPDLVKRLDGNGNEALERDELSALLVIEPHLVYEANFGETGDLLAGGTLKSKLDAFANIASPAPAETLTLEAPGARLQLAAANPKPNFGNYDGNVTQLMSSYDKDKNGYLDKDEVGAQPGLAQQYLIWDADSDGKVYPDEIKKSYERQQIPTWQRIAVSAADQGNSLFSLLDADSSGRISLREMKNASERLKTADKSSDGQITLDEIPGTIRLTVARGNSFAGAYVQVGGGRGGFGAPVAKQAGPDWFVRMDRNGDGDVTMREFLGDEEQFKKLDTNGDGFIELKEAEAVK